MVVGSPSGAKGFGKQVDWKVIPLTVAACDGLREDWDRLSALAVEPNPFSNWYFVRSSAAYLKEAEASFLFQVWDSDTLIGLMPIARNNAVGRLPFPVFKTMIHDYAFLGTPLIADGFQHAVVKALTAWLDTKPAGARGLHLDKQALSGSFVKAVLASGQAEGRPCRIVHKYSRAAEGFGEASALPEGRFSRKKKIRSKFRKLQSTGVVVFEVLKNKEHLTRWTDEFLALEKQGWKAEGGTAIASDAQHELFFRQMLAEALSRGHLRFCRLTLDNKAIAYSFDLVHGREAFALKIAHDRAFNQFSPGVLLEQANSNDLLSNNSIDRIDSCAAEDHSVLNSLWTEKKEICQILIGGKGFFNRAYANFFFVLDYLGKSARQLQKSDD